MSSGIKISDINGENGSIASKDGAAIITDGSVSKSDQEITANLDRYNTCIVEMVFPNQTNHYGTLFGGHALELMDKSAFITASRYSRKAMVTACSERVDFKAPVKLGDLIEVVGRIIKCGTSSVTVEVDLFAEDLLSGDRQLCARGRFVLVAVSKENKPLALKATNPISEVK